MTSGSAPGQTAVGDLVRELYEAAAAVRAEGDRAAASAGHSVARWQVLYMLARQPRTVPGVARRLGLTRQSVQRTVDLLAREGLLAGQTNPDHRRSPLYALNAEGHRALRQINAAAASWHRSVLAEFSADELEHLRGLLGRITRLARTES